MHLGALERNDKASEDALGMRSLARGGDLEQDAYTWGGDSEWILAIKAFKDFPMKIVIFPTENNVFRRKIQFIFKGSCRASLENPCGAPWSFFAQEWPRPERGRG